MKKDFLNKIFRGDKGIWFIFMFLCMVSIVEVFSAASQLTYHSASVWSVIGTHGFHMLLGLAAAIVIHLIPHKWWKLLGPVMLLASFVMLIYLLVASKLGIIEATNDSNRWINLFGLTLQPSEIAKLAVVIVESILLASMNTNDIRSSWKTFGWIMGIALVFTGIIFTENLSTAALLMITVVLMTIIAGVPRRILLPVYSIGGLFVGLVLLFFIITPPSTMHQIARDTPLHRIDTWQRRLTGFIVDLPENPSERARYIENNYQITHALMAVSRGNIIGVGPGNSVQRDFLPHAENDFIFAIILEELGVWGGIFVIMLYIALLVRCGKIARKCRTMYSAMLVTGCALMLVIQAFIHMLISVNLFPVTGLNLPLISRGGTSVIITCMYFGIILNVSRSIENKPLPTPENDLQPANDLPAEEDNAEDTSVPFTIKITNDDESDHII